MISVIVPFWNAEEYIGRCIDSLNQPGDFEFIFVDDFSTDSGADRFSAPDERFRLISNERTKGVSGARNTGIDHASGEWITFLDVDDEWLPGAYQAFKGTITSDERANIHQFNHIRYYTKLGKQAVKYANGTGVYSSAKMPQCWFGVWNKLFRREFLTITFDEHLRYGEDGLFVLECLALDDYIHHAHRNCYVVKHRFDNPQSLSKTKREEDIFDYWHALERFIRSQTSPQLKRTVCGFMSEQWATEHLLKIICDKQK